MRVEGYEVPTTDNVYYQRIKCKRHQRHLDYEMVIKVIKATRNFPNDLAGMRDAIVINLALRNGISTVELTKLNVGDIEFSDTGAVVWVTSNNDCNSSLLAPEVVELIERYFALRDNPCETEPFLIGTSNNNKNKHLTTDGLRMLTRKRLLNSGIPKELCSLGALRNTKK